MNKTKWKEMNAQNTKMKIMEGPKGQNESTWTPKEPKMKDQKAKMKAHEGPKSQNERKWRIKRPKWKEMKAQKGKHESKWSPRRPKWKEIQGIARCRLSGSYFQNGTQNVQNHVISCPRLQKWDVQSW